MNFDVIDTPARLTARRGMYADLFDAIASLPPGKCVSVKKDELGQPAAAAAATCRDREMSGCI